MTRSEIHKPQFAPFYAHDEYSQTDGEKGRKVVFDPTDGSSG